MKYTEQRRKAVREKGIEKSKREGDEERESVCVFVREGEGERWG